MVAQGRFPDCACLNIPLCAQTKSPPASSGVLDSHSLSWSPDRSPPFYFFPGSTPGTYLRPSTFFFRPPLHFCSISCFSYPPHSPSCLEYFQSHYPSPSCLPITLILTTSSVRDPVRPVAVHRAVPDVAVARTRRAVALAAVTITVVTTVVHDRR